MEILVQGTKGGSKVLYPTPTPNVFFRFAGDVRRIDGKGGVGHSAYSIAFAEKGCIFSKYVGVRDVERSWDGYVAFSVFVPNTRKLAGSDAKMLLDDLAGKYCQDYVVGGNLGIRQEDWIFVTALANQYENRLRNVSADDMENYQQGSAKAAFAYYSSSYELQKYFDAPCQEEYSPYKQVFFIENGLPDLLNLLQHDPNANLTGKIDLENPRYKLKDFYQNGKNGISIELWANNRKRSNKDIINRKDTIRIRYSKNDRYFSPIDETGKISDSNIAQYLFIVDENKITVKNDVILHPVVQRISLEVKNRNGNTISDAEITCINEFSKATKSFTGSEIRFEGEELKDRWTVSAKKGDMIAQPVTFTPEGYITSIPLVLIERKKVTFQVIDDDGLVFYYSIHIKDERGNWNSYKDFVEFYGDAIDKSWEIKITHNKYQTETFNYCPAKDENPKFVKLQKRQSSAIYQGSDNIGKEKKYYLKFDKKFGKRSFNGNSIPEYVHNMPDFKVDARYGYTFVQWVDKINEKYQDYDGYYEAQFKELWWHKIPKKNWILSSIILVVLIGVIALITQYLSNEKPDPLNKSQIQLGLQQNSDNLDLLNQYKTRWDNQKPEIKTKKKGGIFGFGGKSVTDSTKYKKWQETGLQIEEAIRNAQPKTDVSDSNVPNLDREIIDYLEGNKLILKVLKEYKAYKDTTTDDALKQRIDQCITLRTDLEKGYVFRIKQSKFPYSANQEKLKSAMDAITYTNQSLIIDAIKQNAKSISKMNLDEIAYFITQKITENSGDGSGASLTNRSTGGSANDGSDTSSSSSGKTSTDGSSSSTSSLETEFWNLVHNGNDQKDDYTKLINKYKNNNVYENSDVMIFLNKICKDSKEFVKFKNIPKETRVEATTLSSIAID